jgi:uncharacterized phage protein (TIGR02220 family)
MNYIKVKNFNKYQHYHKEYAENARAMVWFKWHVDCLQDYDFTILPNSTKWIFIGLMCLACKTDNKIPYDIEWLEKQISGKNEGVEKDIKTLLDSNLVALCYPNPTAIREDKIREEENRVLPPTPQGDPVGNIIEYLNQKAGRQFNKATKAHRKFVEARLKEGISEDMLKRVVDYKTWDWQDKYKNKDKYPDGIPPGEKDMSEFIRPETIFNATKCASYIEQVIRWELKIKIGKEKKKEYQDSPRADLKDKITEEVDQEMKRKINQLKDQFGGQWFLHYNEGVQ